LRRLAPAAIVAVALNGVTLGAHDLWIEPTSFSPAPGAIVGARLRVGQGLLGDPVPRDPALVRELVVDDGSGRTPLVGRDGADPAGFLRVGAPGLLVIGYRSHPSVVELPAGKFDRYLEEEGLDAIRALRARDASTRAVREMFSRCAKSLVLAGAASRTRGDRVLGFTLELVAERNPYAMTAAQELPVRLTYEGRPLAGALVVAMNQADSSQAISARSDHDGRVRFRLARGGMWMIKAVHMIPARPGTGAEWESFWASLTFALPHGPGTAAGAGQ
jgi:hypothetical protein